MTFSPCVFASRSPQGGLGCHKAIILARERFSIIGRPKMTSGAFKFSIFAL